MWTEKRNIQTCGLRKGVREVRKEEEVRVIFHKKKKERVKNQ